MISTWSGIPFNLSTNDRTVSGPNMCTTSLTSSLMWHLYFKCPTGDRNENVKPFYKQMREGDATSSSEKNTQLSIYYMVSFWL